MVCYLNLTSGWIMIWQFFRIGDGKGAHDGTGAVIKWFLCQEQLNVHGVPLQNVSNVVSFLRERLSKRPETFYIRCYKLLKRLFWFVGVDDVDRSTTYACDPILGTQKMHSIYALNQHNVIKLMIKNLACFCCFCMEKEWSTCLYVQWIREWKLETLKPADTHFVWFNMEKEDVHWDYGEDGDAHATCLEIRDNFVVNVAVNNDEGQEFWTINYFRPLHKIKNDFTNAWCSSYEVGDDVVVGTYYQKWGTTNDSYVLSETS